VAGHRSCAARGSIGWREEPDRRPLPGWDILKVAQGNRAERTDNRRRPGIRRETRRGAFPIHRSGFWKLPAVSAIFAILRSSQSRPVTQRNSYPFGSGRSSEKALVALLWPTPRARSASETKCPGRRVAVKKRGPKQRLSPLQGAGHGLRVLSRALTGLWSLGIKNQQSATLPLPRARSLRFPRAR
jgi:hypothetical protein